MTSTLEGRAGRTSAPERTCVVCRRERTKAQLLRVARTPEGVRADPTQRLPGRGAYVCRDTSCVRGLTRRSGGPLQRALPGTTDDEVRAVTEALEAALAAGTEHQRSNA